MKQGQRVQLNRAMSKLGFGSRKQAWDWIVRGEVRVDGRVVTDPLAWVDIERQRITRQGEEKGNEPVRVLALHKPRGIVTTRSDERGRKTVYDLLPAGMPWIFPAGRLDADSEGLLILTNDSKLAETLTDPDDHVPKTYRVTVRGEAADHHVAALAAGVALDDGKTRPCTVDLVSRETRQTVVTMVLREGRNRQIRRMWESVGFTVIRLERLAIGAFGLGALEPGAICELDAAQIAALLRR